MTEFWIACDVKNCLHGKKGAAYVFASQKGANEFELFLLDKGLKNLDSVLKRQFNIDVQNIQGSGAAGGLGAGAIAFLNATLVSGIDLIKELANFDQEIKNTDWIITGEGKLDGQTLAGKTIAGVIESARKKEIPVAALCGSVSLNEKEKRELGLDYCVAISKEGTSLDKAMLFARENLVNSTIVFCSGLINRTLD